MPSPRSETYFAKFARIVAVALAAVTMRGDPISAAETCVTDWGAAGDIVRRERLVTVESLATDPSAGLDGTIVKATLCEEDGNYIYRLVVRGPGGKLNALTIDAKGPAKAVRHE